MASFSDKLKEAQLASTASVSSYKIATIDESAVMSLEEPAVMTLDMSIDDSDATAFAIEEWVKPENANLYDYYNNEYADDSISTVDKTKNIILSTEQINLTQEKNSQYMPFMVDRYYDGYDLSSTKLSFYWVHELGHGGTAFPVDVYYNSEKIKFAWLVDDDVTAVKGNLEFEIHAEGTNSLGRGYLWKTKPSKGLNVIQALEIKTFIEPDESWQTSFVEKLSAQADRAEKAALNAEASATAAQNLVDELQDGLADEVSAVIADNYYTKNETHTYVSQEIEKADISDKLSDYALKTEIPEIPENVSAFTNDAGYLTEHQDISGKSDIGHTHTLNEITDYEEPDLSSFALKTELPSVEGLASETFVQEEISKIDVSDQLGDTGLNEDGSKKTVVQYVDEAVASVDVTEQLENYYTKDESYSKDEVDEKLSNVKVDLTGYATETFVNEKISPVNTAITSINQTLEGIDKSPRVTYDATYGDVELDDGSTAEYMFTLWKTENGERTPQDRFQILGGGGSSTSTVNMKIAYVDGYPQSIIKTVNDSVKVRYLFEGVDSAGDYVGGTASWKVGSKIVLTEEITSGEHEVDLTDYVGVGDNKILLTVTHATGAMATKAWTIKVVDVRIESNFNNERSYPAGSTVEFTFTPYGSVDKVVHFKLDGVEIGTKESKSAAAGLSDSYILPAQEHGSHLLEVWMTSDIADSNHIYRDIVWYDAEADKPVIGCSTPELTVIQHDTKDIYFTVFDPSTETPTVIVEDNGVVVATLTSLNTGANKYQYVATTIGTHEVVFICGDERKSINVIVEELNINITPVTAGLAFDFNPVGYSNNSENRLWSYDSEIEGGKVSMTVSDNFDWINGGYQSDKDGSYFCIKAGTTATIDYKMFCATKDISSQGGHYKLIFKTMNVQDASKPFLQCFKDNVGVIMQPHETNFYAGSGNSLYLAYSENDTIEFELNMGEEILNSSDKMVMGYEDGVATKPLVYTSGATFIQGIQDSDAEYITLGSTSCDLYIYRFKAYRKALTSKEVINNFITDARSASEMLKRYNRNNIYNEAVSDLNISTGYSEAYIEHFAKQCADLRVILLSCPRFTKSKSDKVQGCNVRQIYTNGREIWDNWIVYNMIHSGQGTSSNLYGASGRNLDLIMNKKNDAGEYPTIEFADGTTLSGKELKLNLTETSVPIAYLNIKLNIASSENANNAELARRYNQFNPYKRPLVREDGYEYNVKDTMEFYNCVVFVQETDTTQDANGNYTQHVEFNDCNWHYYGLGNIGDSKKTDETRMNDPNDVNEFVIEVMDNNLPNSKFQSGVYDEKGYSITGAEVAAEWQTYKDDTYEMEGKYTVVQDTDKSKYLIDDNLPILFELIDGEYILTSDETIDSSKTYYEKNYPNAAYAGLYKGDKYVYDVESGETELESGWGISFECRYEHDDSDHDEHIRLWNEFYEFVIFSSDKEFYEKLSDYCVMNSVMFYYLFTLRYTMIDNRAKNSFWHYAKCEDGKYRWDLTMDYDNDTALGIDNFGKQVYRYGYEDFDYVDSDVDAGEDYTDESGKAWVFNAATSTFYNRLRLLFAPELRSLYNELDGKGAWDAEDLITQWDASQSQFPEEVWRQDIIRKYIRPYTTSHINGKPDTTFLKEKMNGRKKYHRREFERNQEIYFASKYRTEDAKGNIVRLRAKDPSGELAVPVNLDLTITPYMHMYVSVDYANGVITRQYRAKAGEPVVVDYPLDTGDIIAIESAPYLQSIGDLSGLYTQEATLTTAIRLKEVLLGNPTEGYANTYLQDATMPKDGLIEIINIENIPSLDDELDVSTLRNLKTVLAKGSGITGLILAKNCAAETLSLPSLSSLLSMKNLVYLKDIDFDSLENLSGLIIEDCDLSTIESFVINEKTFESVNELTFLDNAPSLNRVRLTGVNWSLPDTNVLERLYSSSMGGYNASGAPTTQAYISGYVYIPVIKQYDLLKYQERWSDLEIEAGVVRNQVPVYFKNYDGTILDTQYVLEGEKPVDPVTSGRIDTPVKPSDPQYDYTYIGWDASFANVAVGGTYVYTAQYKSVIRKYTIKYVQPKEFNISTPLQEISDVEYGSYVSYTNDVPTYTIPEDQGAFTYYLFSGWDQTGYVDGDKVITAKYDKLTYTDGYFTNKELKDMTPVEIYALTKLVLSGQLTLTQNSDASDYLGIEGTNINQYDEFYFSTGHDVDYNNVESVVLIGEGAENDNYSSATTFSGTSGDYYDTGISLFDTDRSFVFAVDYEFASGNTSGASTLLQCIDDDYNGFKLYAGDSSAPTLMWGGTNNTCVCASGTNREMLVIRHKAGEKEAYVYTSNLSGDNINAFTLVGSYIPSTESEDTLVFGCAKSNNSIGSPYTTYGKGTIHCAKLWYDDLGDTTCHELASYIHEKVSTRLCGFARYYLSGTKSFPVLSFMASKALYKQRPMNQSSTNAGGWASCDLNNWLNTRFYNGIPLNIKQLIKQVEVKSTIGEKSSEYSSSDCYIYIPAYADLSTTNSEAGTGVSYSVLSGEITPGKTISYMSNSSDRIVTDYTDEAVQYSTRSPAYPGATSTISNQYFYRVNTSGGIQPTGGIASTAMGVVIMFSI